MDRFARYIEELCREHKLVKHSDEECHFSSLVSDFDNKLQRKMCYPCVAIDTDGFRIGGSAGNVMQTPQFNMYFLQHVRDHGDLQEKLNAFDSTLTILNDFVARMMRDKMKGREPVARFSMIGAEAYRIEFTDAALYGWGIALELPISFNTLNCNNNFTE